MTNASSCLITLTPHKYGYKLVLSVVVTVGIVSNILVILSLLRQKRLLKNNFYFLVFHLSISDLSCLLLFTYNVYLIWSGERLSFISCTMFHFFRELFVIFGAYFMLVISIIRYRAVLHPLKPAISFGLLKIIACFVYVSAFLASSVMHYMSLKASILSLSYEIIIRCGRVIVWYFLPACNSYDDYLLENMSGVEKAKYCREIHKIILRKGINEQYISLASSPKQENIWYLFSCCGFLRCQWITQTCCKHLRHCHVRKWKSCYKSYVGLGMAITSNWNMYNWSIDLWNIGQKVIVTFQRWPKM